LHASERASAEQLRAANCKLAGTVEALERKTAIHDRLTRAALVSEGPEGIAVAVHELTGFPVAVEDGHGNLLAWAGPGEPVPLGRQSTARRERVLARALREGRPIRAHNRLLTAVQPRPDVLGVLALIDPDGHAGEPEQVALEHGATVLAMELARLHSLAETELRLGHNTVAEVLDGTNPDAALARARALGYDLDRPHRVVLVDTHDSRVADEGFLEVVRRAARATALGSLLLPRDGAVVVLSAAEPAGSDDDTGSDAAWERFRVAVEAELGGLPCRVGVGGVCGSVDEFPRGYREAQLALRLHDVAGRIDHAVVYDRLGVYQLLAEVQDLGAVERHARHWLGPLLDYDARRHAELVPTLSRFLECGGNYDSTARSLQVGRSTLRYRLRRIREISGHDHSDPDTRFNLQLATRGWRTLSALVR
jgi:sugar diacid utilization regulator